MALVKNVRLLRIVLTAACCMLLAACNAFAQQNENIECTLDLSSTTIPLPKALKPGIDLSGRGYHSDSSWPQELAAPEALDAWQREIGFNGVYRLQFNLWEINELAKDKQTQEALLRNYESIIQKISDAGGVVILDIFGTPAGLGKVLDKKSPPWDLRAFKELIKGYIRELSCNKKYTIWYEIWTAPDLDDFFLGRQQEYLNLYRAVAETINELKAETKIYIPLGGPSVSWWFQNLDGNTVVTPERSLIYELIKFCRRYHLPLDFITWHGYSTDPKIENEATAYNKTAVALIRDWLSYFNFDRNMPLIVDEWNYDSGINVLPERKDFSNVCASYALSRMKSMYEAGLDYQLYFCLEDFQNNKEGVVRNVGVFWFDPQVQEYRGGPKSAFTIFKLLATSGDHLFTTPKTGDDFVDTIAIKSQDTVTLLVYNYIDPSLAMNYISESIYHLNESERRVLLNLIKQNTIEKVIRRAVGVSSLRVTNRVKALLKKAQELNDICTKLRDSERSITLTIKNVKEDYVYQRYVIDASCGVICNFVPVEEKTVNASALYKETLILKPYSVAIIMLKKQPPQEVGAGAAPGAESEQAPAPTGNIPQQANTGDASGAETTHSATVPTQGSN